MEGEFLFIKGTNTRDSSGMEKCMEEEPFTMKMAIALLGNFKTVKLKARECFCFIMETNMRV
jgi:hypothetical protein